MQNKQNEMLNSLDVDLRSWIYPACGMFHPIFCKSPCFAQDQWGWAVFWFFFKEKWFDLELRK